MGWVMTSKKIPGGIDFCIGAVKVASVRFVPGGRAALWISTADGEPGTIACPTVKAAMQLMYNKLNSPPPEGFQVPQFAR